MAKHNPRKHKKVSPLRKAIQKQQPAKQDAVKKGDQPKAEKKKNLLPALPPPKPVKKTGSHLALYQKLVKALHNEIIRRGLPFDYKKVREFVSEFLYPHFKGEDPTDQEIIDFTIAILDGLREPEEFFNPLHLPIQDIAGIAWYEIDGYLMYNLKAMTAPKNLRYMIEGGSEFGRTDILNLKEYDQQAYVDSGLENIITNIRIYTQNKSGPEWIGFNRVRPGFENDGQADSYFLQFVLYINGQPVVAEAEEEFIMPIELDEELSENREQVAKSLAKERELRRKERQEGEFQKVKRGRERPTEREEEPGAEAPAPAKEERALEISREIASKKVEAMSLLDKELDRLRKDYDDKIFTAKEYKTERQRLIDKYTKIIDSFEKGGEV